MMHTHNKRTCWLLVFLLVAQLAAPLFAQTDDLRFLHQRYQSAYRDYNDAVLGAADEATVRARLQAYETAYQAYLLGLRSQSSATATTENQADSANTPTLPGGSEQTPTATEDPVPYVPGYDTVQTDPAASALDTVPDSSAGSAQSAEQSWFARTFTKLKEGLLGKPGSKEMPWWEKILWNIGKAVAPAAGVMLVTALLAPLSPVAMVIGGIVVGASLGGMMTYAYEKRMNAKYREVPKEDAKIWRDVTVQAAVEAVMAPFNLATGGLFGMVGPTVGKAIGRVALTQAALTFTGHAVSSQVGGLVKHLWAEHYFHYPEKIKANEARIDEILMAHIDSATPLSEESIAELDRLRAEIATMKSEDYGKDDMVKDLKRAAVSSVISGFAGSVISDRLYTYETGRWADAVSVKLFGSTVKGKAISSLLSTMPVNFAGGVAGAELEKVFINEDVSVLRQQQQKFPPSSGAYEYYERVIQDKLQQKENIKPVQAGLTSVVDNFAVRAAQLSVEALKYHAYDAPKARKAEVERRYQEQDPEWNKANALQEKVKALEEKAPNPLKYKSPAAYAKAMKAYKAELEVAKQDWMNQCLKAKEVEATPQNIALKESLDAQYKKEVALNQILELGRLSGGEKHVAAMKKVLIAQNPGIAGEMSDDDLTYLACQAIRDSYVTKSNSCNAKLNQIEEILQKDRDYKAGKLALTAEEAKLIANQADMISPSKYKAALVEQIVYEQKANNVRWQDIERDMPRILQQAERQMLEQYGGNWGSVLVAETYANALGKYKYTPDGNIKVKEEMQKLFQQLPKMFESNVIKECQSSVNNAIVANVLPSTPTSELDQLMATYAKATIRGGNSAAIEAVYTASRDTLADSFFH